MSTIMRKKARTPEDLKKLSVKEYNKILKKALMNLQEASPDPEKSPNPRFFYIVDFPFSDEEAPMIWLGAMTPAWKKFYKQHKRQRGFAAGSAYKTNGAETQTKKPYLFTVEEGKGIKKGFIKQIEKAVKRGTGKQIAIAGMQEDAEAGGISEDLQQVESSKSSIFDRIRTAIINYKNVDAKKAPIAKAEARQLIEELLVQWDKNTLDAEKTKDQKKFIKAFKAQFEALSTLFVDYISEMKGLYMNIRTEFIQCRNDVDALEKKYDTPGKKNSSKTYPKRLQEYYTELLDLKEDIGEWQAKHDEYFKGKSYQISTDENSQIPDQLKLKVGEIETRVDQMIEELKQQYKLRKKEEISAQDLSSSTPQVQIDEFHQPSDKVHPALVKQMSRFNELLKDYGDNMEVGANLLQNKLMDISDNIFVRNQQIAEQTQDYRNRIAALQEKFNNYVETLKKKKKDISKDKYQKELNKIQDEIKHLNLKVLGLDEEKNDLKTASQEIYKARKGIGATGLVDKAFERILDLFDTFNSETSKYKKNYADAVPSDKKHRRRESRLRHKIQDRIDWLEAEIQSWQEENINLDRSEIKTKNRQLEAIRAKIKEFAAAKYGKSQRVKFSFDYTEGDFEAPVYDMDNDKKYLGGLTNGGYDAEQKALKESLEKKNRHWDKDDKKTYYKERQRLLEARIKKLRGHLERIGSWQLYVRPFANDPKGRLESRKKKMEKLETAVHKELQKCINMKNADLIGKNAAKADKKYGKLEADRQKTNSDLIDLFLVDTSSLSEKKLQKHQEEMQKLRTKLQHQDAQLYRETLNALEGVYAGNHYIGKLETEDNGLWGHQAEQNAIIQNQNMDRIEAFVEDMQVRYDDIMAKAGPLNREATVAQLEDLEKRASMLYVGLEKAQSDNAVMDIDAPERIQEILLKVQQNLQVLKEGNNSEMNLGYSLKEWGDQVINAAPDEFGKDAKKWEKAAREWIENNKNIEKNDTKRLVQQLEAQIQQVLDKSDADDVKTFLIKQEINSALDNTQKEIDALQKTLDRLQDDDQLDLEDQEDRFDELKQEFDALKVQAAQVTDEAGGRKVLGEILSKSLFSFSELQKEILVLEATSPAQIEKEKEIFAAFSGDFDLYHNRGFVIPDDELMDIGKIGMQVTDRAHQLLKLGLSPEDIQAQMSHIPYSFWPDNIIKEMQDFKRTRNELMGQKVKEAENELGRDEWDDRLDQLINEVEDPAELEGLAKTIFKEHGDLQKAFGSTSEKDFVKFALGDLKLNEDGDAKDKKQKIDTAITIIKTTKKIAGYAAKASKKGEKYFGTPNEDDDKTTVLDDTPAVQAANALKGVAKILQGAVMIAKLCQDDPSRNPQQEFNTVLNKYWDGCTAAYTIGAGVVGVISAFQDGLDQIAGAFSLGLGVFQMAKGITNLMEHKRMHHKTGKLQTAAALEDDTLMYAMHQEMGNLEMQMKKDKIEITKGAILATGGAADAAGMAIGVGGLELTAKTAKTINKVIDYSWKTYEMKVNKKMVNEVNSLLGEAAAGNRDVVGQIFSRSPYFAKMLVVCRMFDGDFLAQQYCIQRGIAPEDLDNEFYSKKLLHEFLIKDSGEKESTVNKVLLGSQLKVKLKSEKFEMPETADEELKNWFNEYEEEDKSIAKKILEKMSAVGQKIEELYDKAKEKGGEKLKEFKVDASLKLGVQVSDYRQLVLDKKISPQEQVELLEEYNKLQHSGSKVINFFKKKAPYNKLLSVKSSMLEEQNNLLEQKQNIEQLIIERDDPKEKLELAELNATITSQVNEFRVINNLYESYGIN